MIPNTIRDAVHWILEAKRVISLTGAGISTPSGIPDFRSPQSGLWEQVDPMVVASIWGFRANPQAFYEWIHPLAGRILEAQPNPAHVALAELEAMGKMRVVITQNIDGLHQRAGSKRVLELHGHLREAVCLRCGRVVSTQGLWQDFVRHRRLPRCPSCAGILKPAAVLFGELLPHDVFLEAQEESQSCEVMIVAGSSLEVAPASELPFLAHRAGARIILINCQPTPLDRLADVLIQADVAIALPSIVEQVRRAAGHHLP